MEETDSVVSSEYVDRDMSYLFGRDPSILAYGQQPYPVMTRKVLYPLYETKSDESSEKTSTSFVESTIKVYLRMKPFPEKFQLSSTNLDAYKILNSTTLLTKLPNIEKSSNCSIKRSKSSDTVCRRFTFTKTFLADVKQVEIFEQAVKSQMMELLTGKSSVVMSYGTTNAGKSYTLQGSCSSPGIIPRSLEYLFSHIIPDPKPCYKIINNCNVISLNHHERIYELDFKDSLLSSSSSEKLQFMNSYKQMQCILEAETTETLKQRTDIRYSIWVSFAEIYNETIHDLLCNDHTKKLKISTDSKGRPFIRDLTTVSVQSAAEAYQILLAGQYNLKVAATALNARSSRSHCIFTIKLLGYSNDNEPRSVQVSTFSFCDLAGSERLKKTLNVGDRLKEAQNINTSLLVLGRCLKSIYEGQLMKNRHDNIGPFRESKLTRLFQNALSGKENLALIVNVNPLPNFYNETLNVLKFCAIAKKIVIERKEKKRKNRSSRFSSIVVHSMKTVTDWDIDIQKTDLEEIEVEEIEDYQIDDSYRELVMENKRLKKEIKSFDSLLFTKEVQIRNEMADNYARMIEQINMDWKNRVKDVEKEQESMFEFKIDQFKTIYDKQLQEAELSNNHKRQRSDSVLEIDDERDKEFEIEELKLENEELLSENNHLKEINKKLRVETKFFCATKNECQYELESVKKDLQQVKSLLEIAQTGMSGDKNSQNYIKEMELQLSKSKQEVKKLKGYLDEAKQDYLSLTIDVKSKDQQVETLKQINIENEEKINDLEGNLEDLNICLADQIKKVELQETEMEIQNDTINQMTEEMRNLKLRIQDLEREKLIKVENDVVVKEEIINNDVQDDHTGQENLQLRQEIELHLLKISELEKCLEEKIENSKVDTKDTSVLAMDIPCRDVECQMNDSMKEKKIFDQRYVQTDVIWEENLNVAELQITSLKEKCCHLEDQHLKHVESEDKFEKKIRELEEEISNSKNKSNTFMEVYFEKMLSQVTDLQKDKINELNENIKTRQTDIDDLRKKLVQNEEKLMEAEKGLTAAISREKEKDHEIVNLQKELKTSIQKNTNDEHSGKQMEVQLKDTLKELNQAKELISREEQNVLNLNERLNVYQLSVAELERVKLKARDMEIENMKLKRTLEDKEDEMEVFKKHRDDTIEKYENLVKSQQSDLESKKRDLTKYQEMLSTQPIMATPNTEERKKIRTRIYSGRSKKKESCKIKEELTNLTCSEDVSEVSGSESKRSTRRTALAALNTFSEVKKSTRKKKLFTAKDDSFVDVEPIENDSPVSNPPVSTRSLRMRRK